MENPIEGIKNIDKIFIQGLEELTKIALFKLRTCIPFDTDEADEVAVNNALIVLTHVVTAYMAQKGVEDGLSEDKATDKFMYFRSELITLMTKVVGISIIVPDNI